MKLIKNSSLNHRSILITMAVSCITVIIMLLLVSIVGFYEQRSNIQNELVISAAIIGEKNKAELSLGTREQALSNLSMIAIRPDIVQACLYDGKGVEFAHYTNTHFINSVTCPKDFKDLGKNIPTGMIEHTKTIGGDLGMFGYLYMLAMPEPLDAYLQKQILIIVLMTLLALPISYGVSVIFQRRMR